MNDSNLSEYLFNADQSVKNFIALLLENISNQQKNQHEPVVQLEFFSLVMEIRLLSIDNSASESSAQSKYRNTD